MLVGTGPNHVLQQTGPPHFCGPCPEALIHGVDEMKGAKPCSLAGRTEDYLGGVRIGLESRNHFGRELV